MYLLLVDRDIVDFGRFAGQRNYFGIADRGYRRTMHSGYVHLLKEQRLHLLNDVFCD